MRSVTGMQIVKWGMHRWGFITIKTHQYCRKQKSVFNLV